MERVRNEEGCNWGEVMLGFQNEKEGRSCCDLKLICSDGFVLVHRGIIPKFREGAGTEPRGNVPPSPHYSYFDGTSQEIILPCLTLVQLSKLAFILYSGEALLSKREEMAIRPVLGGFGVNVGTMKRVPFSGGGIQTRRSSGGEGQAVFSSREALISRKIRAVKSFEGGENVWVFGDGKVMGVGGELEEEVGSSVVYFDENGGRVEGDGEKGGFCGTCELIFGDGGDFWEHFKKCEGKREKEGLPRVLKMEADFIKVEGTVTVGREEEEEIRGGGRVISTINVCLLCVHGCKDAGELIIHSHQKHQVCPDRDYDLGSWKCKRCRKPGGSHELSVFLQHVYHCGVKKRKRSAKETPVNTGEKVEAVKRQKMEEKEAVPSSDVGCQKGSGEIPEETEDTCHLKIVSLTSLFSPAPLPPSETPTASYKIPKIPRILAFPPPLGPVDSTASLIRSPKALAPINGDSRNNSPSPAPPSQLAPIPSKPVMTASSYPPPNLVFTTKPTGTFHGATLNNSASTSSKSLVTSGTSEITRHWLPNPKKKKNAKKPLISNAPDKPLPTWNWNCYRCTRKFPTQKGYMVHHCQTKRSPVTSSPATAHVNKISQIISK